MKTSPPSHQLPAGHLLFFSIFILEASTLMEADKSLAVVVNHVEGVVMRTKHRNYHMISASIVLCLNLSLLAY
jgi:hypothetical protein